MEYVDGYNPYIYCGQNPWGRWDPLGLARLEPVKSMTPEGPVCSVIDINGISFWAKSRGTSSLNLNSNCKYYTGQESLFDIVDIKGKSISITSIVFREVSIDSKSLKMIPQIIKELLQDSANNSNITIDSIASVTVTSSFRLYKGDIPKENVKKSDVVCADSIGTCSDKQYTNKSQNFNSVDDYSKAQVEDIQPYLSDAINLDQFEKDNNLNLLDVSNKVQTTLNVQDYTIDSKVVEK